MVYSNRGVMMTRNLEPELVTGLDLVNYQIQELQLRIKNLNELINKPAHTSRDKGAAVILIRKYENDIKKLKVKLMLLGVKNG